MSADIKDSISADYLKIAREEIISYCKILYRVVYNPSTIIIMMNMREVKRIINNNFRK